MHLHALPWSPTCRGTTYGGSGIACIVPPSRGPAWARLQVRTCRRLSKDQ